VREKESNSAHDTTSSLGGGWTAVLGLVITGATADEVRGEWNVTPVHHQPHGIIHGGVHCSVVETLASVGAHQWALRNSQVVVGLENTTSFIRAVRSGRLYGVATPLTRGRTTQVWEVRISDEQNRLVATGRVRLLCLDPDREVDGKPLSG
jgi:uncharacterized protein (TIGR00369 family)